MRARSFGPILQPGRHGGAAKSLRAFLDGEADDAPGDAPLPAAGELPRDVIERRAEVVQSVPQDQAEAARDLLDLLNLNEKVSCSR